MVLYFTLCGTRVGPIIAQLRTDAILSCLNTQFSHYCISNFPQNTPHCLVHSHLGQGKFPAIFGEKTEQEAAEECGLKAKKFTFEVLEHMLWLILTYTLLNMIVFITFLYDLNMFMIIMSS